MSSMGAPYFTELPLRCGKCEERWTAWQPNNCHSDVWIAAAQAHKCPKCGESASVFIVTKQLEPADAR